jgi:uncharacterized protein (TIGR03663 family)
LALRLPRLALRPMHADEAKQAVKAGVLLETGVYRYDPRQHHGPTLYYLTLPAAWLTGEKNLAGMTEATLRTVPVLFGVGLVLLLLPLATGIGRAAAIAAGVLTALSPAMVFYSRYYVQEMLLVFFTFGVIVGGWRMIVRRSPGWAAVAGISLGLMFATKETWILAFASMGVAAVLAMLWGRCVDRSACAAGGGKPPILSRAWALLDLRAVVCIVVCIVTAKAAAILFFSSFFTHWRGLLDSVLAYETYFRRAGGEEGLHVLPFDYYLAMLANSRWVTGETAGPRWSEGLILALAVIGAVAALWPRRAVAAEPGRPGSAWACGSKPLVRFLAFYTLALTVLYSLISYKTPWCVVGPLHGMILLAGVGAAAVIRLVPTWPVKSLACLVLAALAAQLGWQAYLAAYRWPADQRNPYVYAQTSTDFIKLVKRVNDVAAVAPDGRRLVIKVITDENYWPLPWYLRNFDPDCVGYYREIPVGPGEADADVIIATAGVEWQEALDGGFREKYNRQLDASVLWGLAPHIDVGLRGKYNSQSLFRARPEVFWCVYVREDLWNAMLAAKE